MYQAIVFLPLLGFLIVGLFGTSLGAKASEYITSGFLVISAVLSWVAFFAVGFGEGEVFTVPVLRWIQSGGLEAAWALRIDTLTVVMLVVVNTVSALVHIYSIGYMHHDPNRPRFFAYLSLFTFAMLMLVTADNLVQMFFGWEGVGLASYLLIGFWYKKPSANAAAIKAFVVNRVGDFGFALGIFGVFVLFGSVNLGTIFANAATFVPAEGGSQGAAVLTFLGYALDKQAAMTVVCLLLFMGAMGKSAQVPLHTWLPDAHVEAPTAGSVILAAILLKMGGYGFLRFSLPMFPIASEMFAPLVFALSVVAIIYTSLVALMQEDMKKLIAYSSVAHMGFVTMGIFAMNQEGVQGAIFQMLSHGLVSGALFLCVGVIYDRMHTRDIDAYGGLVNNMPKYATVFMIFTMANVGLPGTSGFVGEFLTMLGVFRVNTWVAFFAATGVILSAAYALWLYRRVIFGALTKDSLKGLLDLSTREKVIIYPLAVLVIFFGVYPAPVFDATAASVKALVTNVTASIDTAQTAAAN
ncbi:MAG: NADH-quinone oxidoreductase subunit M [Mesorhizobium sp.]|nr:MAG: NADH-quinone oxidoreductase subunit M [Mesorhizobium sp.]